MDKEELTEEYERSRSYDVHAGMAMYGPDGTITPSGLQKLVVDMIESHLEGIEMGEQALIDRLGMSWVLLSTHIELNRSISPGEHLIGHTWNSGINPPIFRRDFVFLDATGERAALGATYSTLLSVSDRRFCTDRAIIGSFKLPAGEKIAAAPRRAPRLDGFEAVEVRRARPSMTDAMGHVNNTRYGEFVYDAMTADERARMRSLRALDVWFAAEMREGDEFRVEKAMTPDGRAVRGVLLPGGAQSFLMKLTFSD